MGPTAAHRKKISIVSFFFAIPLLGLRVSPFILWVPTLHTEGLQQFEVSSMQPASLRLRWVYVSAISVCFRTPRLSLGHPVSLTSMHDLKCMRTQTAPLFNAPRGRRGNRAQVPLLIVISYFKMCENNTPM